MKKKKLDSMIGGWFIGSFKPTIIDTEDVEVAVKEYKAGDAEDRHLHKIATEITVLIRGRIRMNNSEFTTGDIIIIEPGESSDFNVLEDSITAVVKFPGAKNDKYIIDSEKC